MKNEFGCLLLKGFEKVWEDLRDIDGGRGHF
jgi:hypothetical protein